MTALVVAGGLLGAASSAGFVSAAPADAQPPGFVRHYDPMP